MDVETGSVVPSRAVRAVDFRPPRRPRAQDAGCREDPADPSRGRLQCLSSARLSSPGRGQDKTITALARWLTFDTPAEATAGHDARRPPRAGLAALRPPHALAGLLLCVLYARWRLPPRVSSASAR